MSRRCCYLLLTALLAACGADPAEPTPSSAATGSESVAEAPPPAAEPVAEAAPRTPRDLCASSMEELFAACRDGDLERAAAHIVYRGPDEARRWRSPARTDNPEEARAVTGICQRVGALLAASTSHEKLEYESERQSEGVWHVWHVSFATAQGPVTQIFAFLEVDGRFLLGDID